MAVLFAALSVGRVVGQLLGNFAFPAVAIGHKFFLVVHQLFAGLGRIFEVRPFDDGVDRAGLFAKTAVDAFGHVDVIAGRAPAAIGALFGLDGDRLGRANSLAKLAGNTALFAIRIAAQRMLAAEARAQAAFFLGVIKRHLRLEEIFQGQPMRLGKLQ